MRRLCTLAALAGVVAASGCLTPPERDADAALFWGTVRLVPKEGVASTEGGYADRRLQNVARVDYSQPGFVVVFCAAHQPKHPDAAGLTLIQDMGGRTEFEPRFAAATAGGELSILNETSRERVVSIPELNWIRALAPGASARVELGQSGEVDVFLIGGSEQDAATVWVSPGVFTTATSSGRYALRDPGSGAHSLSAWRSRLPVAIPHTVDAETGDIVRIDLEIGVDRQGSRAP